jgi:hypothetical protein
MRWTRRHVDDACMPRAGKFLVDVGEVSYVIFTCPVTKLSNHLRNFISTKLSSYRGEGTVRACMEDTCTHWPGKISSIRLPLVAG